MRIVHYDMCRWPPVIGKAWTCYPTDHPDTANVSNETAVFTSNVQCYDERSGVVVTQNTVYVPSHK